MYDENVLVDETAIEPFEGDTGFNTGSTATEENISDDDNHAATSNEQEVSEDESFQEESFNTDENGEAIPSPTLEGDLEMEKGFDPTILEKEREDLTDPEDDSNLLDAYYADLGDPVMGTLLKQKSEIQKSISEVVIDRDDRIQIKGTKKYPWRTICSLRITAKDGSRWIGTGWLVGPRTVMTAGHVVYMHSRGGWAKSIEVIPGRNGSSKPFGSCKSRHFHSVKGWTSSRNRKYDYGCIVLPKNCAYGKRLGYFGFGCYSNSTLKKLVVNLSGYPGDKPAGTQWWHARRIKAVTSRTLVYNIDTAGGQSGSPVWWYKNKRRYAVGIHTNGSLGGNSATRIVKPVYNNIKKWKKMHP